MGCGSGNCGQAYPWNIRHLERPVKGGWSINELPASVATDALTWAWNTRPKKKIGTPDNAVTEMKAFLRVNGVVVTKALIREIGQIADAQYCAAEPHRCPPSFRPALPSSRLMSATKTTVGQPVMAWAARFWSTVNVLVASDYANPAETAHRAALMALDLVSGDQGCPHCVEHWSGLLAASPPLEVIKTNDDMRVWFWRAHNISREGKEPTPFRKIAKEWKWNVISDDQVKEAVDRMGMADLV